MYQEEPPSLQPSKSSELNYPKIYFERSLRFPFFRSGTNKPSIPQGQAELSASIKVNIPRISLPKFSNIVVFDVTG